MEILIGRENSNLRRLQLTVGDVVKLYGEPGSVPKSVSRQHCKLMISGDKYMIESLSDNNVIYVNCKEYLSKYLKKGDVVLLGEDGYELDWEAIMDLCLNALNGYSLAHLKPIWERYDKEKLNMQINSSRFNALSSISGLLTSGSFICMFIPQFQDYRATLFIIGFIMAVCFAVIRFSNSSKLPMKQRELDQWFHKNYVCPNPKCRRFLGVQPFDDLVKNVGCPNCKSKYRAD